MPPLQCKRFQLQHVFVGIHTAEHMTTFCERLRDSMTVAGMSDTGLAVRCNVSEHTVAIWLRMTEAGLSGKDLALAGMALGVSLRWLALGTGTPVPIGLKAARNANSPQ